MPLGVAPAGYSRTGTVWPTPEDDRLSRVGSNMLPQGYRLHIPPLSCSGQPPAFCHSAAVGRRLPTHRANATASYQQTPTTGCSALAAGNLPFSQSRGPACPERSVKRATLGQTSVGQIWRSSYPPDWTNFWYCRLVTA